VRRAVNSARQDPGRARRGSFIHHGDGLHLALDIDELLSRGLKFFPSLAELWRNGGEIGFSGLLEPRDFQRSERAIKDAE
jgi:hypothetical protein